MEFKIYEKPITINQTDIDDNGHVNNLSHLKWVQDIAIAHWTSVATKELEEQYMWVVSRHEIDYLKQAFIDTKLIAKTWVTEPEGAKSFRYVEIYDAEKNTIIAKIKTTWYLLDAHTKKPKRINSDIVSVFL